MNAAEHIVQSFFWEADSPEKKPEGRRYLTMSNVIGGNNSEIDIIAMSGNGKDRLRVECEIAVNWYLEPEHIKGRMYEKFFNPDKPQSRNLIDQEIFHGQDYRKIFVVWDSPFKDGLELDAWYTDQGAEVWSLTVLLKELLQTIGTKNYQDDILRIVSMYSSVLSMQGSLRRLECKRVGADVAQTQAVNCVDAVAALAAKIAQDQGRATVKQEHVKQAMTQINDLLDNK